MQKVTIAAIAERAGVGVATVDRVLNRRAPVRTQTEQRVLAAAAELGYRGEQSRLLTGAAPADPTLRMGFVLLTQSHSFYQALAETLSRHAQPWHQPDCPPTFCWHDIDDVTGVAQSLRALASSVDVIGLVALDHPLVRHAVEEISRQGVRVYTLFSDLSRCGHAGFIGLDNQKAGRTAAWIAQRLVAPAGSIGILLGDHRFNCQETCEISFRSWMREQGSERRILEPVKTVESEEGGYRATRQLLENNPDLGLIYAPCGGIEGAMAALRNAPGRRVPLLCHGPVRGGELALIDGTIEVMLRQDLEQLAAAAMKAFVQHSAGDDDQFSRITLPFEIVTRENL